MDGMKKRNVGRPRDGNPAETRREILEAAEECFAASGFVGATTRQVAARAGVNVATLHYHFGNKERLYRAVLDAAVSGEVAEAGRNGSPVERLTAVVESLWTYAWTRPALPRLSLLHRLAGPPAPNGGAHEPLDDPRARLLSRTIADVGVKGAYGPDEAARLVLVLMDGALVASQNGLGAGAPSLEAPRRAVVAAALHVTGLA
jgi:AcrR family transcriptional regulator